MPHLTIYQDMGSNGSGIFFKNIGLGPAIITHFLFEIDGKFIDISSVTELLRNRIPMPLKNHGYFVKAKGKNQSIVSNSEPFLIIGTINELQPREMIEFLRAVKSVKIHIAYKSMYGDAHRVKYLVDYIPKAIDWIDEPPKKIK